MPRMRLPQPEMKGGQLNCDYVVFRCPLACSWAHTEPAAPDPSRMIIDPADVEGSMTVHSQTAALLLQERVEGAWRNHLEQEHPGAVTEWEVVEVPETLAEQRDREWAQRTLEAKTSSLQELRRALGLG